MVGLSNLTHYFIKCAEQKTLLRWWFKGENAGAECEYMQVIEVFINHDGTLVGLGLGDDKDYWAYYHWSPDIEFAYAAQDQLYESEI